MTRFTPMCNLSPLALPRLWRDFQTCRRLANEPVRVTRHGLFAELAENPLRSPYAQAAERLPRWLLRLANATAPRGPAS